MSLGDKTSLYVINVYPDKQQLLVVMYMHAIIITSASIIIRIIISVIVIIVIVLVLLSRVPPRRESARAERGMDKWENLESQINKMSNMSKTMGVFSW